MATTSTAASTPIATQAAARAFYWVNERDPVLARKLAKALVAGQPSGFEILEGKMAIEIRANTVSKGRAVDRLMSASPFAGRTPVFVGDDATDNDGFRAAERMKGLGLGVFERFAGRPAEVRYWLKSFAGN